LKSKKIKSARKKRGGRQEDKAGSSGKRRRGIKQWYSTFFVRVPPDITFLQPCTPKVVGV
jgi:hypothetical protein